MNNIFIDTEKLIVEIDRFRKIEERLVKVFEDLNLTTDRLKEAWSSDFSEIIYLEYSDFIKYLESLLIKTRKYISYLDKMVKDNYVSLEKNIGQAIDTNITN